MGGRGRGAAAVGLIVAAALAGGTARAVPLDSLAITPPADITVAADSVCGQSNCVQVSYSYTVTGGVPPYRLVCNLDSGSYFLVGTHTISCLAQDSVGNSTPQASFTLTVTPGGPLPPPPPPPPPTLSITPPADMTVAATTACGASYCATVNFIFAVTGGYPPYRLVCTRYSGEQFSVGTWHPACLAQDSMGDSTPQPSFTLVVTAPASGGGSTGGTGGTSGGGSTGGTGGTSGGGGGSTGGGTGGGTTGTGGTGSVDTTAPTLAPHANVTVNASSRAGAAVRYVLVASDPDDTGTHVTISCTPSSGTTFPLGPDRTTKTTTVTCRATDAAGNAGKAIQFRVTVLGVHGQLAALERAIAATRSLASARRAGFVRDLRLADAAFAGHRAAASRARLAAFVQDLRPLRTSTRLHAWVSAALRIEALTR